MGSFLFPERFQCFYLYNCYNYSSTLCIKSWNQHFILRFNKISLLCGYHWKRGLGVKERVTLQITLLFKLCQWHTNMIILRSWVPDYVCFLDHVIWCNLLVIIHFNSDQILFWTWFVFFFQLLNLRPQTSLMSQNGRCLAEYVGCVTSLALVVTPGALLKVMGRG